MQNLLKLVILVILAIFSGCQCVERRDNTSQVENNTYDALAKPKWKKLFEIRIK